MNFASLNPYIRSVALYEKINRTEECIAYDSRLIYMLSGDISVTVDGENIGHLTPGSLLYIPSGVPYKLKGKYLRAVVISFDLDDRYAADEGKIAPVVSQEYNAELCHSSKEFPPFSSFSKPP